MKRRIWNTNTPLIKVVGVSNYRSEISSASENFTLALEPDNEHDPNAVAVYAEPYEEDRLVKVGYLAKEEAEKVSKVLSTQALFHCRGTIYLPKHPRPHYGIRLNFDYDRR